MATTEKNRVRADQDDSYVVLMEDPESPLPWGFDVMHRGTIMVSEREKYGSKEEAEQAAKTQFPALPLA